MQRLKEEHAEAMETLSSIKRYIFSESLTFSGSDFFCKINDHSYCGIITFEKAFVGWASCPSSYYKLNTH
jgi:hypothetical protein